MLAFNFLVLEHFLVCLLHHKQNINKEFHEQQMEHYGVTTVLVASKIRECCSSARHVCCLTSGQSRWWRSVDLAQSTWAHLGLIVVHMQELLDSQLKNSGVSDIQV